ncbi:MAG: hypothetical protein EP338_02060 [Bacteroidetes bacterium]|nr:MAG: hypothetical protein EP338_02060 [Bacteroidota bacterium]
MSRIPIADKKDERKGLIAALFMVLLIFLYLKLVSFTLADPPPKDIPLATTISLPKEINLKKMIVEGGGSGKPTEAPVSKTPESQTQKVITKQESKTTTKTGESNHSTKNHDPNNQASTTQKSSNPFNSGGSGDGEDGGDGHGFGQDQGDGSGPGKDGGQKPRIRLNDPNNDGIQSDQDCKIFLKLTVNGEGRVIKAQNIVSRTTTVNQVIINQVISNVKSQVRYNQVAGAAPEIQFLTVNLSAR